MPEIDFRAVVKEAMARRGLNTKSLADAAGIADPIVYRFLSGQSEMRADSLAKLLDVLGVAVKLPK